MSKIMLAIDPSIRHVGWATKVGDKRRHGTIEVPQGLPLPEVLHIIRRRLHVVLEGEIPTWLIVEYPEFHTGQKGATAAVQGTTFGLAAIAGFLQGYWRLSPNCVFHYRPSQWKGQVPKDGMKYRFQKRFGYWPNTDHEAEAALMIDYHLTK